MTCRKAVSNAFHFPAKMLRMGAGEKRCLSRFSNSNDPHAKWFVPIPI